MLQLFAIIKVGPIYDGAQLSEIAADRTKGAVYDHFKSKEDLFFALFEHRTRHLIDRLQSIGTISSFRLH